jgi:serine/threonine protein kinase
VKCEFVDDIGGELFEFLNFTGSFDESIARTYFHQLIAGVECAHRAGVAHRDLKPENLLLDANFVLKLADFGFSNVFTSADHLMYTECGTPGYMYVLTHTTIRVRSGAMASIIATAI